MERAKGRVGFLPTIIRALMSGRLRATCERMAGRFVTLWITAAVLATSQAPASGLLIGYGSQADQVPARNQSSAQPTAQLPELELGKPIERELSGGQAHSYRITLAKGHYLHVVVDQRGIDVVVLLHAPNGTKLREVDSPNGTEGPEPVSWIAEGDGPYWLEVRSVEKDARPGKYEIRVETLRRATAQDPIRLQAEKDFLDGWVQQAQGTAESRKTAREKLSSALSESRGASDRRLEADVLNVIALVCHSTGQLHQALEYLTEELPLRKELSDRAGQARNFNDLGRVYGDVGENEKALYYLNQALPLRHQLGDRVGEATTLNNFGLVYGSLGEKQKAMAYYDQALLIYRQLRDRGSEAGVMGNIAAIYDYLGEKSKALDYYNQALLMDRQLGDRVGEATTLNNSGLVYDSTGEKQKALDYYDRALQILEQVGDRHGQAATLTNIGVTYHALGDMQKALDFLNRSLPILRQAADPAGQAVTLNEMGLLYDDLGEKQSSIDCLYQALPLRRQVGDRAGQATTLNNLGRVYSSLNEKHKALEYYSQALLLSRQVEDRRGEAATLSNIGSIYGSLGENQNALDYYSQALQVHKKRGDRRSEATTLNNLGVVYLSLGEKEKALDYFNQALPIHRIVGNLGGEANTLNNIGAIYRSLGDQQKAIEYYGKALELQRQVRDREGEYIALMNMSVVRRVLGQVQEAKDLAARALELAESVRRDVAGHDSRSSFSTSIQEDYDYYADLLMTMDKETPNVGLKSAALQVSERARARTLLDLLVEAHADVRSDAAAGLLEHERSMQHELAAKEQIRIELASKPGNEGQLAMLDKDLGQGYSEYEDLEAEIRSKSPKYASLTQPQPLDAEQIQKEVLDGGTILLEFSLGPERSYLWVVSSNSVSTYELPKGDEIGNLAINFARSASAGAQFARGNVVPVGEDPNYRENATKLSRILLGPAAALLGRKRLLIVAGGPLEYVPFAALPDPAARGNNGLASPLVPLIASHEVVVAPSASAIAELRTELRERAPRPKSLAILADPVFSVDDPRVKRAGEPIEATARHEPAAPNLEQLLSERVVREASDRGSLREGVFARLTGSKDEANQIARLLHSDQVKQYLDFEASKAIATDPSLANFRYIHFATHGVLDAGHPDLTGVVLSTVDRTGNPVDWFLAARDIYNLKLSADMVVLSACETGLGKQIRGEGLVGLTRGFMYAGAPRVIASLWKVDDAATAELMTRLYTGILKEGKRPAAALRKAQLEMWKQKKYQAPYYWAAFELQGEWR